MLGTARAPTRLARTGSRNQRRGARMAWRSDERVAVLLSQRLIGAKDV